MGLKETFANAAATAIKVFGNVRHTVDYRQTTSTYNKTTGAVSNTTVNARIEIILSDYDSDEIDGNVILETDQKVLIPTNLLKVDTLGTKITPKKGDSVLIYSDTEPFLRNAVTWQVINLTTDPARALWTIQIRRP